MVQNKNNIVKALAIADMLLTIIATSLTSEANKLNILPIIKKNGAPGSWTTSNLYAAAINSPQSHKLAVFSIVDRYTNEAIKKIAHPM